MKQRLNIEMILRVWLMLLVLLTGAQLAGADTAPPLYTQVAGGEQEITIEKPISVDRLALEKGVRWVTVVRQNCLKKPYKLKPGMVHQDQQHPHRAHGAAKRPGHQFAGTASVPFPERGLSAALCPGRGQAQLAHPHRDL